MLLKPASPGTGVIAGGGVRAVLELAGIHDILSKSLGTQNPINLVKATVAGLRGLRTPEEVGKLRGLSINQVLGLGGAPRQRRSAGRRRRDGDDAGGRRRDAGRRASRPRPPPPTERPPDGRAERHPAPLENGANRKQLDTLRSLGLRRIGHTVEVKDSEQARGMLHAVRHLVEVKEGK